jgi:hypothetical protein
MLQKIGGQPKATAQFFEEFMNASKNWWAAEGNSSIF